jgi:hypothetical protein
MPIVNMEIDWLPVRLTLRESLDARVSIQHCGRRLRPSERDGEA